MQWIDGRAVYSATDLVGFQACEHLTNLERAALAGLVRKPLRADPELDRLVKRGLQHEQRFLTELADQGRDIQEAVLDGSEANTATRLIAAARETAEAMRDGVDVIYQATFFDGRRRGHADFLMRIARPSDLGSWSYEVWDTKLARSPKGSAVLQLCFYSDLLAEVQGSQPEEMHLALGGSEARKVAFRTAEYSAYYRLVVRQFEQFLDAGEPKYPPTDTRPDPVEHCNVCRWSEVCQRRRREVDDLSLVAGISGRQRRSLRDRGVATRTALGSLGLPMEPPIVGASLGSLQRVREQARIQVEGEEAGQVISERLAPSRLSQGDLEPNRGLLSLPTPSSGDLFFDIEGDPFAPEDGVEYLFGVVEPGRLSEAGEPAFHAFWSIDTENEVTAEAERQAFEAFIDLVMDRLTADPNLHIYPWGGKTRS